VVTKAKSLYQGHQFPAAIINCAVYWFWFQLSRRDIEELLSTAAETLPDTANFKVIDRTCPTPR
jgi:hypothetical protein